MLVEVVTAMMLQTGAYDMALAESISSVVEEKGPLLDWSSETTAAMLVSVAYSESRSNIMAVGDSGLSVGAYQCYRCSRSLLGDARAQTEKAYAMIAKSANQCKIHPLAVYARGTCRSARGIAISADRVRTAKLLLHGDL